MSEQEKLEQAKALAGNIRGHLILSQALYYGIKALESVKPEYLQEKSNIADMKLLQHLFSFPPEVFDNEKLLEAIEKVK